MRPPEQTEPPSPPHQTNRRLLLSRIDALTSAMAAEAAAANRAPVVGTTPATETAGSPSPATGANALPASPPGTRLTLPSIQRIAASRSPSTSTTAAAAAAHDSLDIMRLGFDGPPAAVAAAAPAPAPADAASGRRKSVAAPATGPPPPALIDESMFTTDHDRAFPVPRYLDHSVWRSRMFTYPSPLRTPTVQRMPLAASSDTYTTLLHAPATTLSPPLPPAATTAATASAGGGEKPPASKQRKSQLAASLAGPTAASGDDWTIPLPTCWDQEDRCSLVEVTGDGLEISFCGSGKNGDRDAAAVRANRHMPPYSGIYYYEVEIVSKGQSGYIAVGFSGLNVSLSRLPGWEANSWGYHGDDGHSFASQGTGKSYGPTFSTGDVVGCGIDFTQQRAFFTKNGAFLGYVFEGLDGQLYPSVGMRTPGEVVRANFGQAPFRFDIESFVVARKLKLLKSIGEYAVPDRYLVRSKETDMQVDSVPTVTDRPTTPVPVSTRALDDTLADLVSAYLQFHGFVETAQAFETQRTADRKRYHTLSPASDGSAPVTNGFHATHGDVEMADPNGDSITSIAMGARQRICREVLAGRPDAALELLETTFPVETSAASGPLADVVFSLYCQRFVELIVAAAASSASSSSTIDAKGKTREASPNPASIDLALEYGRELQARYGDDERPAIKEGLRRTFALWAYNDPKNETEDGVRWSASQAARDSLADELNAAILDAQGQSARPVLETVFKQAVVSVAELGRSGHGGAALVDVAHEIFRT